MINKLSIRIRLTVLSILLLIICCVGLTIILNFSANKMANAIEATPILPSISTDDMADVLIPALPPSVVNDAKQGFKYESIIYMLLIVMLGGIITYYLSGKALKPLNELNSQIKNMTVHNLSEDIDLPKAKDEIYDITSSFNEMTHKLNNAFLMQKRFSQSAAHELRTPLTVIKTKLDVFKKRKAHSIDEYNSLIEIMSSHTNRLSNIVKSLLSLSNTEDIELDESIDIYNLLQDIKKDLYTFAISKCVDINIENSKVNVLGNHDLLYRAFYNIIENAIKYNTKDGKIDVKIISNKNSCSVKIADTGIGIPDDMKMDIFEPFFRVDKSRSREIGGAGLGLSIVKSIIEKHSGTIAVESNEAMGTTFIITLEGLL